MLSVHLPGEISESGASFGAESLLKLTLSGINEDVICKILEFKITAAQPHSHVSGKMQLGYWRKNFRAYTINGMQKKHPQMALNPTLSPIVPICFHTTV